MATGATTLRAPARAPGADRRPPLLARWREAWNHALADYYRTRAGWALTPWLGALGIVLVWGIFLGGLGLAVAAYPQATDVRCDWLQCRYPLLEPGGALWAFNEGFRSLVVSLVALLGLAVLCLLPPLAVLLTVLRLSSGRLRRALHGGTEGALLAKSWHNGAMALLVITPLGAEGLVRIRFLARLYGLWRQRALIAMLIGVLATLILSQHVGYPIFWWLGPWGHWGAQLLLVLLWSGAAVAWLAMFAAHATLQEVSYMAERRPFAPGWPGIPFLTWLTTILLPFMIGYAWWSQLGPLSAHDRNALLTLSAPLIMGLVGTAATAWNYALAQSVFKLRLRYARF